MQWDEDRVLQFAGHKDDECSVLQQSFECFCWPSCEQIRSPTFKMLQLHLLRKFEKNEQVGVGVFFEMSKLFKWNFFRKMLLTYSLLKPENIIQKYLPVIKISNCWGILIWATLYTSAALSVGSLMVSMYGCVETQALEIVTALTQSRYVCSVLLIWECCLSVCLAVCNVGGLWSHTMK